MSPKSGFLLNLGSMAHWIMFELQLAWKEQVFATAQDMFNSYQSSLESTKWRILWRELFYRFLQKFLRFPDIFHRAGRGFSVLSVSSFLLHIGLHVKLGRGNREPLALQFHSIKNPTFELRVIVSGEQNNYKLELFCSIILKSFCMKN